MSAKLAQCIGAVARAARSRAKLTQADVAERVGIASEVYGRLERGRMLPSAPTLRKLSLVLGVSTDELLGLQASGPVRQPPEEDEPPEVRRLVRRVRAMKPARRRLLAVLARELAGTGSEEDEDSARKPRPRGRMGGFGASGRDNQDPHRHP
jgi:transcriptional regulator with XRE-family HTH domain